MKLFPLDKYLLSGTEYKTDSRQVLVIEKVGTDSADKGTLTVDQVPCLDIINAIAPLRKNNSVIIGPLALGEYYIVVPPETKFKFTGASGSYLRIIGKVVQLDPGEPIPSQYMARYKEQGKKYITYITGTYSHGVDVVWAAEDENTVLTLKPSTIERYIFDGLLLLTKSGGTFTPRQFALLLYLDNVPLEYIYSNTLREGIDTYSIPDYDDVGENEEPFSLKNIPVEVKGDHTLKVTIKNISGADQTPATGASWTFTVYMVAKYIKEG